jgi:hypothetical protein
VMAKVDGAVPDGRITRGSPVIIEEMRHGQNRH